MTSLFVKSPALPVRPQPVFWHAPTGRFRTALRRLNPLSAFGWAVVACAFVWAFAIGVAHHFLIGAHHG